MSEQKRDKARRRRGAFLATFSIVAALAVFGVVFNSYWDARIKNDLAQNTEVYTPAPKKAPKVALFIGDSMVQGSGATNRSLRFSSLVANEFGWYEVNVGLGGAGYYSGTPNLVDKLPDLKKYKPAYVFVSAGRSDGYTPEVQANVRKFYQGLRDTFKKAKIFVLSPMTTEIPPSPTPQSTALAQLRVAVRGSAYSVDAVYLPVGDTLVGNPTLLSTDGYNPSDAGYQALADAVVNSLEYQGVKPAKK